MAERSQRAIMECGQWLAACMRFGWNRDTLDGLEALWWKHHDEQGKFKTPAGANSVQKDPPGWTKHIAILQKHNDRNIFKLVPVPEGQSLEFDKEGATRRWLWPHIGNEWHLAEFVELGRVEEVAPYMAWVHE